jgi:hypothetical protein
LADTDDVGGFAGIAGVENAAELVVALKKGVGLINQKRGPGFFDNAEKGGGADVGGDEGAMDKFAEDGEKSGFPAAFLGGFQADVRADVPQIERVGVEDPQRERFCGGLRQDDEPAEEFDEVVKEELAMDIIGPGFDFSEAEELIDRFYSHNFGEKCSREGRTTAVLPSKKLKIFYGPVS